MQSCNGKAVVLMASEGLSGVLTTFLGEGGASNLSELKWAITTSQRALAAGAIAP